MGRELKVGDLVVGRDWVLHKGDWTQVREKRREADGRVYVFLAEGSGIYCHPDVVWVTRSAVATCWVFADGEVETCNWVCG